MIRHMIGKRTKLTLTFNQRLLGALPLSDIRSEAEDADNTVCARQIQENAGLR